MKVGLSGIFHKKDKHSLLTYGAIGHSFRGNRPATQLKEITGRGGGARPVISLGGPPMVNMGGAC